MKTVQRKYSFRKICYCSIILMSSIVLLYFSTMAVNASDREKEKRILYLSSYSYSWDAVQELVSGVQLAVNQKDIFLDYAFMETRKGYDERSKELFFETISRQMNFIGSYDLIIAEDNPALEFVLTNRKELFDGLPIVFLNVTDEKLIKKAKKDSLITGFYRPTCIEENIKLGFGVMPEAKRVVGIIDSVMSLSRDREAFLACKEKYPDAEFMILDSAMLSEEELISQLRGLREDDIVLYVSMSQNKDEISYTDRQAVDYLVNYAKGPVIRVMDAGINQGLLGGYVLPMKDAGREAGNVAVNILYGASVSSFSIRNSTFSYLINEEVLKKFSISKTVLPENSRYINHVPTWYENNSNFIKKACIIGAIILFLLIWLAYENIKMRKMMKELRETRKIMEDASHHDFLTSLPNRSKFVEDLKNLISQKQPCTVFMLDIDDFKHINDSMGHGAGDEALKEIAARMKKMQSGILTPYRYAGDEFIMILRSEQHNLIEKTAYETRQVFFGEMVLAGQKKNVTGSIGVATYPKDAEDMEQLIICADEAMYEVKKSGKNKFAYYKGPRKVSTKE